MISTSRFPLRQACHNVPGTRDEDVVVESEALLIRFFANQDVKGVFERKPDAN